MFELVVLSQAAIKSLPFIAAASCLSQCWVMTMRGGGVVVVDDGKNLLKQ